MLELIFGIIILGIVIFIAIRVLKNITVGLLLIFLVFLASYLIIGSFPDLAKVPLIGKYLRYVPKTTGEMVAIVKGKLYSMEIIDVGRDFNNNLLITIVNTGKKEIKNFKVSVDDNMVNILNSPKDPLKSGEVTIIQVDWRDNFSNIYVKTDEVTSKYPPS